MIEIIHLSLNVLQVDSEELIRELVEHLELLHVLLIQLLLAPSVVEEEGLIQLRVLLVARLN